MSVTSVLECETPRPPTHQTLEEHRRNLSRDVLSIICSSTGRQRTPDECARLDALVREIGRVRNDLRSVRSNRA